jgi:hypothetical protein
MSRLQAALVALLVLSTALLATGVTAERSLSSEHAETAAQHARESGKSETGESAGESESSEAAGAVALLHLAAAVVAARLAARERSHVGSPGRPGTIPA